MANDRVVKLVTGRSATNKIATEMLTELLAEAQKGDLIELAVAYTTNRDGIMTGYTDFKNAGALIGAVYLMLQDLTLAAFPVEEE